MSWCRGVKAKAPPCIGHRASLKLFVLGSAERGGLRLSNGKDKLEVTRGLVLEHVLCVMLLANDSLSVENHLNIHVFQILA